MFKILNLSNIFYWIEKLIGFINSIFFILLLVALSFALIFSPPDYLQGDSVRIMYVHVPSAWLASFLYLSLAISCIFYLVWKHPLADLISSSIAPIGVLFSLLTLITGSLWGKPMWGTWWVWDARLTSMLILFFFYLGFILLHDAFERKVDGSKSASVLGIIGIINSPRNGNISSSLVVNESDEIILSTDKGSIMRCAVKEIRVAGRNTQGVRIKKLSGTEKVVSVIKIEDNIQ